MPSEKSGSDRNISSTTRSRLGGRLRRAKRSIHYPVFAIALIGLITTMSATFLVWRWDDSLARKTLADAAENHFLVLQEGLDEYLNKLVALRALFESSDHITRAEFETFARRLLYRESAIQNFSWVPLVAQEARAELEAAARGDGIANYRIKTVTPDDRIVTSPEKTEYLPIYYSTVGSKASPIYGIDLLSQPVIRTRLEPARDYDQLSAVPNFVLHSQQGEVHGFLFSLPVYRGGEANDTVEQRRRNLVGFAHGAFLTAEAVDHILASTTTASGLDIHLFASNAAADAAPLHVHWSPLRRYRPESRSQASLATGAHVNGTLKAGDARWALVAVPVPGGPLAARYDRTWLVLAASFAVSLLVTLYARTSVHHARRLMLANEEISNLAQRDSLTGLANRRAFNDQLEAAFAASRRSGPSFALLYFDLDHFKDVNDTLGHPAGDDLLRQVADRVLGIVRREDTLARFGGDEFAVLQVNSTTLTATALAGRINDVVAEPYALGGNAVHLTASIGIAHYASEVKAPDALMMQADLALYRAKADGRNCYRFHDVELDREVQERVMVAEELRRAVEQNELAPYYQPQVDLASGRIVGVEALLRWRHPRLGLLEPEKFIAVAERTGTISAIGHWLLGETCRQMRSWCDGGISPGVVAVNVSAGQFGAGSHLEEFVAATICRWDLAPSSIEIELTESVLMEVTEQHDARLERLRQQGVRIAIDDFGIGYSSLSYLTRYPMTRLKIAQKLVLGVIEDERNATVVRAAIRLAEQLGIECVAEGVQNAEQARFLIEAGCRYGQGYHYSEPLSAERMTALLMDRSARLGEQRPRLELVAR